MTDEQVPELATPGGFSNGSELGEAQAIANFPVVPSVNWETLLQLFKVGTETDFLDYKEVLDPADRYSRPEFARDLASMGARGGYIVVGVDDDGMLSDQVTDAHVRNFDEAKIREMVRKWLPDNLTFLVAVHVVDSKNVALIYVRPHPDGLVIFKERGSRNHPVTRVEEILFEKNDIYVRRGTQNVKINQEELRTAIDRAVQRRTEERLDHEIRKFGKNLQTLAPYLNNVMARSAGEEPEADGTTALRIAAREPLKWDVSLDILAEDVRLALASGEALRLKLMLTSTAALTEQALTAEDPPLSVEEILDRVITIAGIAATLEDKDAFDRAVAALSVAYHRNFNADGQRRYDTAVAPTIVWRDLLARIHALGGLLVRLGLWSWIRDLVLTGPIVGEMRWYGNWIRHALTEASREERFRETSVEPTVDVPLIPRALEVAEHLPALRSDQYVDSPASTAEIRESIRQFDVLAALIAMQAGGAPDSRHFYTNFVKVGDPGPVRKILESLVADEHMRDGLGLSDDAELANGIQAVLDMASKEQWMRFWRMDGLPLDEWVRQHATRAPMD